MLLFLALMPACGAPAEDPGLDRIRLVTDGAPATQVVDEMYSSYGGYDTWRGMGTVEYRCTLTLYSGQPLPVRISRQLHRFALGAEPLTYIEDLDAPWQVMRLEGERFSLTQSGIPVADPSQVEFRQAYTRMVRWSFLLPWNLLDPGSRLESRGVRTPKQAGAVPAGPCDVIRLRFERATDGGGTDDWHDLYISRLSRLVEQVHSYRSQRNDYLLAVWSENRTADGLRLAARRDTYASDASGSVGALEAVAEYADVRFDPPAP